MMMAHERGVWYVVITAVVLQIGIATGSLQAADDKNPSPVPEKIPLKIADTARLEVRAYWDPIKETADNFHRRWEELRNLRPAKDALTYDGADFRALLPAGPVAVGEIWELSDEAVLKFLRQLHPGATLKNRYTGDSLGAYACLRTYDDRVADILFRVHTELVMKEGHFTPGQLAGRLVLDRLKGDITFFRVYLPAGRVNFDVNWRVPVVEKIDGKEVRRDLLGTDSGFLPRLELAGGEPEVAKALERLPGKTVLEVNDALARRFYKFKEINWIDFDKALALAKKTGKLLHVVSIGGPLDDESC